MMVRRLFPLALVTTVLLSSCGASTDFGAEYLRVVEPPNQLECDLEDNVSKWSSDKPFFSVRDEMRQFAEQYRDASIKAVEQLASIAWPQYLALEIRQLQSDYLADAAWAESITKAEDIDELVAAIDGRSGEFEAAAIIRASLRLPSNIGAPCEVTNDTVGGSYDPFERWIELGGPELWRSMGFEELSREKAEAGAFLGCGRDWEVGSVDQLLAQAYWAVEGFCDRQHPYERWIELGGPELWRKAGLGGELTKDDSEFRALLMCLGSGGQNAADELLVELYRAVKGFCDD